MLSSMCMNKNVPDCSVGPTPLATVVIPVKTPLLCAKCCLQWNQADLPLMDESWIIFSLISIIVDHWIDTGC